MIRFEPLSQTNLPQISEWFTEPETIKYVGNSEWMNGALERPGLAIGKEFKGAKVVNRLPLIALKDSIPIGYIEIEVYDKSILPEIVLEKDKHSAAFVYLVAPNLRNQGLSKSILGSLLNHEPLNSVDLFIATTDFGNLASEKSLQHIGFVKHTEEEDEDGVMITWVYIK